MYGPEKGHEKKLHFERDWWAINLIVLFAFPKTMENTQKTKTREKTG